jgi:DNA topoisomerase III
MSTWIDSNQVKKRDKSRRKRVNAPTQSIGPKSAAPRKRSRKRAANVVGAIAPSTPARGNSENDTPLRIPYGNKDAALRLGARYRAGGWYAPAGVDLAAFGERGWL